MRTGAALAMSTCACAVVLRAAGVRRRVARRMSDKRRPHKITRTTGTDFREKACQSFAQGFGIGGSGAYIGIVGAV